MKAGVMYERHKPLVLDDVDLAEPTANEVEVELVASGVCQSNLRVAATDSCWPRT
jgi:Zn-dependent alcohol dehydrogenase